MSELLPDTTSHSHYLVGSRALVFLTKIRDGVSKQNPTTWANNDTRLDHNSFYKKGIAQEIAIGELGVVALKTFWNICQSCGRGVKSKYLRCARFNAPETHRSHIWAIRRSNIELPNLWEIKCLIRKRKLGI